MYLCSYMKFRVVITAAFEGLQCFQRYLSIFTKIYIPLYCNVRSMHMQDCFKRKKTIIHWNLQLSYFQLNQLDLHGNYGIFTFSKFFMYLFTVDNGTVSIPWPLAFSYTFLSINVQIINLSQNPHQKTPQ